MKLHHVQYFSPIGELLVITDDKALRGLEFIDCEERIERLLQSYGDIAKLADVVPDPLEVCSRLSAYFAGDFACLDEIPVQTCGTPFQRKVWQALREIPAGATVSYGDLAAKLGDRKATRAVGMANSQNAIAIVLPCHRVIGASGQLTGYGGGLERKRWLLQHEGALLI